MSIWTEVTGNSLRQGDYLKGCMIPMMELGTSDANTQASYTVPVGTDDLVVLTQSCDLANDTKPLFVALCPIVSLEEFSKVNTKFLKSDKRELIRKGRVEGLHLLPSSENAKDNTKALVVDFRKIYSLPFASLEKHAESMGKRLRLSSPHLEHLSQSFARFFMRVGLPSEVEIPAYK